MQCGAANEQGRPGRLRLRLLRPRARHGQRRASYRRGRRWKRPHTSPNTPRLTGKSPGSQQCHPTA
eukprot:11991790-Alexandrium_andersonii.AAC.1